MIVEPVGDLARAPAVLRLRVRGGLGKSSLSEFRLFEGALSSYHLGRIRARELPSTLLAREIEVVSWVEATDVVVAPARALETGVVSLATPELGLVAEAVVDAELVPWLERRWPGRGERRGSGLELFCGPSAPAAAEGSVSLAPSGVRAEVRLGLDETGLFADSCVRLEPEGMGPAETPSLPPALVGEVALEPLPLVAGAEEAVSVECGDGELALGPACARLDDDRLVLGTYGEPSLWALEAPSRLLGVVSAGASLLVRGLEPGGSAHLLGAAFDGSGARFAIDTELPTRALHAHVVISEVLANPTGSEATSEWVELVNDGRAAVDLADFALSDAGASVALPSLVLDPGAFALVVGADFDPDPALDVVPAPGTKVLRLSVLGDGGLSNTGEPLRLRDPDGGLLSLFPSLPARHAGVSLARRAADALDAEAASFGEHADPGASPGAPNTLAAP